jgi:hypothetical protein
VERVLDRRPRFDQSTPIAEQAEDLSALQRWTLNPRELTPEQEFQDQLGVPAVILLAPSCSPANLGSVSDPRLMAESEEQFFKPSALAAGLNPDGDFAGELSRGISHLIMLMMERAC